MADYAEEGNLEEAWKFRDLTIRVYLLMMVSWNIFTDTSKNTINVSYLQYFNDLEIVDNFAWGATALTHMYKSLTTTTVLRVKVVPGYMTPLQ
ncbi:serine/threonine-protein phosphatase 7 long form-like protein, partial [Trifolium medium]|nr:serine/threonine-protein phosphatase 7 long form-like protein [Trifolium medium]